MKTKKQIEKEVRAELCKTSIYSKAKKHLRIASYSCKDRKNTSPYVRDKKMQDKTYQEVKDHFRKELNGRSLKQYEADKVAEIVNKRLKEQEQSHDNLEKLLAKHNVKNVKGSRTLVSLRIK